MTGNDTFSPYGNQYQKGVLSNSTKGGGLDCSQGTKDNRRVTQVPKNRWFAFVLAGAIIFILVLIAAPNFVRDPWTSPANACINNLREIDRAKERWELEHHAKANDIVTLNDIKPYFPRPDEPNGFLKLDAKGNLPKCPAGGVYTIGKIGEDPTCSIGPPDHTFR